MKKLVLNLLTVALGLLIISLAWGLLEPYTLDIQTYESSIPNLPAEWTGREIAVIGDLQVGMWLDNTATIAKTVDELLQKKPAAVLIVGDFIYHGRSDASGRIRQVANLLKPLQQNELPTYAVLGNHDYSVTSPDQEVDEKRADKLEAALEAQGITVLRNQAIPLNFQINKQDSRQSTNSLYLVGLDSHMAAKTDIDKALQGVPASAPRIVAMHHPDTFAQLPQSSAPLGVAGHTHGGQLRIPFTPEWSMLTYFKEEAVHADGWIDDYGQPGNQLYVNRGIGFSVVPLRINCPPEVTYFRLTPADSQQ